MMYNPKKHHRRSIRLKNYDYSRAGVYFVTICTQHRADLFGEITRKEMLLNDAGRMTYKWYKELENKRIIRNDDELQHTQEYIANNPAGWADDGNHPHVIIF